jgi:DNA-binding SARP family transcriptional activator
MTSVVGDGLAVRVGSGTGWRFTLLGRFLATFNDEPLEVTGETRDLLAELLSRHGKPVATATLADGLYPSATAPANPNRAVLAHLSRLRRLLSAMDKPGLLVREPTGWRIDVPAETVDLVRAERLVAEGKRALAVAQPQVAAARLSTALSLWRGEPLADIDRPFALALRARLAELRLSAAELWTDAAIEARSTVDDQILAALERLVAANPRREPAWVRLIEALHRAGRTDDAHAAVARARASIGGTDGPLARAEAALIQPYRAQPPALVEALPAGLLAVGPTFVGRQSEVAALTEVLDTAVCDGGQVRLVIGPAGIGKTRLMAEMAQRAADRGAVVRFGFGTESADVMASQICQVTPGRLNVIIIDDTTLLAADARMRLTAWLANVYQQPALVLLGASSGRVPPELASVRRFALGPLTAPDVAALVRLYAPEAADPAALSAAAGASGNPAQVHDAAARWAQSRASRRVDRAAAEMDNWRRGLKAVEAEIAAGVLDLDHVRVQAQAHQIRPAGGSPYPGLVGFGRDDAALFHGRAHDVARLVAKLAGAPVLALVGASGTGKTSLVLAGLLPVLTTGVLPGSAGWTVAVGEPETIDLAALLAQPPRLLVLDRLERAFTALAEAPREALLQAIVSLAAGSCAVLLISTGDGWANCARYPALAELVAANVILLTEPGADQLRLAIERPAAQSGLILEDGLTETLVADALAAPTSAQLAGLAVTLRRLYHQRADGWLTLPAYKQGAVVGAAVAEFAERCLAELGSNNDRELAGQMLVRIAQADRLDITAALADAPKPAQLEKVIAALVAAGLLRRDGDVVSFAHNVLRAVWPRLADAMATSRPGAKPSDSGRGRLARRQRPWSRSS